VIIIFFKKIQYIHQLFLFFLLSTLWPSVSAPQQPAEDSRFAIVSPGHALMFPRDYGAHPDFRIEWWYVTGWLETEDKKTLGFQITFFRSSTGHNPDNPSQFAPKQLIIAHAALSDPAIGRLIYDEKSARAGFDLVYAEESDTNVKLDDWYFLRDSKGLYQAEINADKFNMRLSLIPTQKMLLQGENGFSRKGSNIEQASYYYSEPHLKVTGSIAHQGKLLTVTGHAWLDHEWSSELLDSRADGWDWVSMNLFDGSSLTAFQIRDKDGEKLWAYAKFRNAVGEVLFYGLEQVEFIPQRVWQSPHTNTVYPVEMHIRTGEIEWRLIPLFDDQELDSRGTTGAVYWEGAVRIFQEQRSVGQGYLELTGYESALDL
jgi:predicted secreted hydrolase